MLRYVHTNIIAKDAKKLIEFYKNVFDCKSIGEPRDIRGEWLDQMTGVKNAHITGEHICLPGYDEDHPTLEIFSYDEILDGGTPNTNRAGFAHLAFETDDVEGKLKEISNYFSVSLDELLSSEEILTVAQEDSRQKILHFRDLVFGLLDCSLAMFLFLPFFGQKEADVIREVSLLSLTKTAPYIKIPYLIVVMALVIFGILTLTLQNYKASFWMNYKGKVSIGLSTFGSLLFMISLQPYAAVFTFLFLGIKALMLIKWA